MSSPLRTRTFVGHAADRLRTSPEGHAVNRRVASARHGARDPGLRRGDVRPAAEIIGELSRGAERALERAAALRTT